MEKYKLSNGLTVKLNNSQSIATMLMIFIKSGIEHGASHLLEHMVFRGTQKFPTQEIFFSELYKYGIDLNGATDRTM